MSRSGATYAVTTVTKARTPLFADAALARTVISEIARCDEDGAIVSHAWVVMPDHLHWIFELRIGSLGRCMQAFKSRSARRINEAAKSSGAAWQAGFYDRCLRDDGDLLEQVRYLAMNPVRRGLVARIEDYPFWWCRWLGSSADL